MPFIEPAYDPSSPRTCMPQECGQPTIKNRALVKIVGGQWAGSAQYWPWQASLRLVIYSKKWDREFDNVNKYFLDGPSVKNRNSIISVVQVLFRINGFLLLPIVLFDTMINMAQVNILTQLCQIFIEFFRQKIYGIRN